MQKSDWGTISTKEGQYTQRWNLAKYNVSRILSSRMTDPCQKSVTGRQPVLHYCPISTDAPVTNGIYSPQSVLHVVKHHPMPPTISVMLECKAQKPMAADLLMFAPLSANCNINVSWRFTDDRMGGFTNTIHGI